MGTTTKPTSWVWVLAWVAKVQPTPTPTGTHTHDPHGYAISMQMPNRVVHKPYLPKKSVAYLEQYHRAVSFITALRAFLTTLPHGHQFFKPTICTQSLQRPYQFGALITTQPTYVKQEHLMDLLTATVV